MTVRGTRRPVLVALLAAGVAAHAADPPTWSRDVAPLLHSQCAGCHHAGGSAPFSLTGYDEAKRRAEQIAEAVASGFMPPWLPEPGDHAFVGERRLSASQIAILRSWAEGGAAPGDLAAAPAPPAFPEGFTLGTPDLVLEMTKAYDLAASGADTFRNIVLPTSLTEARGVRAVELRASNPRVVHHATLRVDTTPSSREMDARDAAVGFDGMDWSEARYPDGHFVGFTPGRRPAELPPDMGWTLPAGADVVLQLHLLPSGKPEPVRVSVGLYFAKALPARRPAIIAMGSRFIDIPAGEAAYRVTDAYTLPVDVDALSVYPHAHYLARKMRTVAILPSGKRQTLLAIDDWDFSWQDEYRFAKPVPLPKGTRVELEYVYDNSAANLANPSDPPRRVVFGKRSTDEMCDLVLQVLPRSDADRRNLVADRERAELAREIAGFEAAVKASPGDAAAHESLGVRLLHAGRAAEAMTHLERALAIDPSIPKGQLNLGSAYLAFDDRERAITAFEKAIAAEPRSPTARCNLGSVLLQVGRADEAEAALRKALELQPSYAEAHMGLGLVLKGRGELGKALEHYRAATRLDPTLAEAHYNTGNLLAAQGELEAAAAAFREAVRQAPDRAEAHQNLGLALRKLQRRREALPSFEEAARLRDDWAPPILNIAWILGTDPAATPAELARALELARSAVSFTQQGDASAYDTLGVALAATGDFPGALEAAEHAAVLAQVRQSFDQVMAIQGRRALYERRERYIEGAGPIRR